MTASLRRRALALLPLVVLAARASACPACYAGAEKTPEGAGMSWAIVAMLGFTGLVFGLIITAAIFFWRRARRQRALLSDSLFVNEEGHLSIKNTKGIPEWNNS